MMTIRERVDFAELVLRDSYAQAAEAERAKQSAMCAYFALDPSDAGACIRLKAVWDAAIDTEYAVVERCLHLQAELVELQRALSEGAL
jgi:hypothetical protein